MTPDFNAALNLLRAEEFARGARLWQDAGTVKLRKAQYLVDGDEFVRPQYVLAVQAPLAIGWSFGGRWRP